jgi:hypothetical protein
MLVSVAGIHIQTTPRSVPNTVLQQVFAMFLIAIDARVHCANAVFVNKLRRLQGVPQKRLCRLARADRSRTQHHSRNAKNAGLFANP